MKVKMSSNPVPRLLIQTQQNLKVVAKGPLVIFKAFDLYMQRLHQPSHWSPVSALSEHRCAGKLRLRKESMILAPVRPHPVCSSFGASNVRLKGLKISQGDC